MPLQILLHLVDGPSLFFPKASTRLFSWTYDPPFREVERLLARGSTIISANTSFEAMNTLQATQFDAVAHEYHIHDLNRNELAELMRYREAGIPLFLYPKPLRDPDLDGFSDGIYRRHLSKRQSLSTQTDCFH
jgi:hypothetical protein